MSQDDIFAHQHVTVIEPPSAWSGFNLRELWAYRELLWVLAARDIKVRYKQTVLGVLWALIQPLASMMIFTLIFGRLAKMPSDGYPYPVFVFAALLPWTFFASSVSTASESVVGSAQVVSKVYFPRLIIPLSSVGAGLVDFAVSSVVLLAMLAYYQVGWSINLLAAPVLVAAVIFTSLGVGTLIAALNVSYRDFRYVVPFLVQFWMFATPVVYPVSLIPERWQWVLYLNPMAGLIDGFRACFLGRAFDPAGIAISAAMAMLFFAAGIIYFGRVERRFADVI